MSVTVTRWQETKPPDPHALLERLRATGRNYSTWGNGPGDSYAVHAHNYRKHLVCLSGSICFTLPQTTETVELEAGDTLDLPAGVAHSADVGKRGVQCAETHLPA